MSHLSKFLKALSLTIAVFPFLFGSIKAAGFYVSTTGSDTNPGTITQPWKTIEHGIQTVAAGGILYIRGGSYHEIVWTNHAGTASAPITVMGYPGETAIIDGGNNLPTSPYTLVAIENAYYNLADLEIRNSTADCLLLNGSNISVTNIYCHDNRGNGIGLRGSFVTVENSRVYHNGLVNSSGNSGTYPEGIYSYLGSHNIIRHNQVWMTYGEGLNVHNVNYALVEDNISFDNWSVNLYISDATNVLAQRNQLYATGAMNSVPGNGQVGMYVSDEIHNPTSANNTIINNLVYGAKMNLWASADGYTYDHLLISNNTFVNSANTSGVRFNASSGTFTNSVFENNIVLQEGTLPVTSSNVSSPGFSYSHNLWSKTPNSWASGTGDIIGDPLLTKTDTYANPQWYKLLAGSPAINRAIVLPEVTDDFWKSPRGTAPDIGAHEFVSGTSKTGDVNGDGSVNILDIGIVIDNYGKLPVPNPAADVNNDGVVNILDIGIIIDNYGK